MYPTVLLQYPYKNLAPMGGVPVETFSMEIAGMIVCVHPMFQSTKEYCRPYLTDKAPVLVVKITEENLAFEQEMLDKEAIEEGMKLRKFTDPFLERTAIQRCVAEYLLDHNTLMLHGSTVAVDGKAYLFTAPCGTGKSTHTRQWRELFGDRAVMVNDDKPFLKITPEGVLAYRSPWSGKHGLASNICVPVQGMCSLKIAGAESQMELALAEIVFLRVITQPRQLQFEIGCFTLEEGNDERTVLSSFATYFLQAQRLAQHGTGFPTGQIVFGAEAPRSISMDHSIGGQRIDGIGKPALLYIAKPSGDIFDTQLFRRFGDRIGQFHFRIFFIQPYRSCGRKRLEEGGQRSAT